MDKIQTLRLIEEVTLEMLQEKLHESTYDLAYAVGRAAGKLADRLEAERKTQEQMGGVWTVEEYDETQIEVCAPKESHVCFCNNSYAGKQYAEEIVRLHNATLKQGELHE